MIHVDFRTVDRVFILKPTAWQTEATAIQRLPGARMVPSLGGFVVPEVAVVEVAGLLGSIPPGYLEFLSAAGAAPDLEVIPSVTLGGRVLFPDQRYDAARLYNAHGADYSVPGKGKTTVAGAALHAMLRDGLTRGMVWMMPMQTIKQIIEEVWDIFRIHAAAVEDWNEETILCVNYEKSYRDRYAAQITAFIKERGAVLHLDESNRIGNANLASDQIMRWRYLAPFRWAGCGTPIQNRVQSFYRPHVFVTGSDVDEETWLKLFTRASDGATNERTLPRLRVIIKTYASRRTKEELRVLRGGKLPPPAVHVHRLPLSGRQAQLYAECASQRIAEVKGADEKTWKLWLENPFERMLRELQVCRDPRLIGEDLQDKDIAKCVALAGMLEELAEEKVVVWSGHPDILDRVVARHGGVAYHGRLSVPQRAKNLQTFLSDPACKIFAANYRVAGVGLDGLQKACSSAVVLDLPAQAPDWEQIMGRLDRPGQQDPVNVYVLLAAKTVEEFQYRMILKKNAWNSAILGDTEKAQQVILTKKDLIAALKG